MPAPWITLVAADLADVMREAEQNLSATVPSVLANLTAEIRDMIATWSPNTLSADATKIPLAFKANALIIARSRILTGVPEMYDDEARKEELAAARKFFDQVAKGDIRPQPADDAIPNTTPNQKPAGVEIVSGPGSRTGRSRMDGI